MSSTRYEAEAGKYLVHCMECGFKYFNTQLSKNQYGLYVCDLCMDPIWDDKINLPKHTEPTDVQPRPVDIFRDDAAAASVTIYD